MGIWVVETWANKWTAGAIMMHFFCAPTRVRQQTQVRTRRVIVVINLRREAVRKVTLRTASMKKSSSFLKKFPFPSWLRALEQDKLSPLQCHILCVRTCWRRHCHSVRTRVRAWPTVIAIMTQFESPRPRTPTFTFCLGCFAAISKEFREYASKLLERTMTQKGQRQIQTFAWR